LGNEWGERIQEKTTKNPLQTLQHKSGYWGGEKNTGNAKRQKVKRPDHAMGTST